MMITKRVPRTTIIAIKQVGIDTQLNSRIYVKPLPDFLQVAGLEGSGFTIYSCISFRNILHVALYNVLGMGSTEDMQGLSACKGSCSPDEA